MLIIPINQAEKSLPQLVKRAAKGETIFIGNHGWAEAVLTSSASIRRPKRLGLLEGQLIIPDDFDDPLPFNI